MIELNKRNNQRINFFYFYLFKGTFLFDFVSNHQTDKTHWIDEDSSSDSKYLKIN